MTDDETRRLDTQLARITTRLAERAVGLHLARLGTTPSATRACAAIRAAAADLDAIAAQIEPAADRPKVTA